MIRNKNKVVKLSKKKLKNYNLMYRRFCNFGKKIHKNNILWKKHLKNKILNCNKKIVKQKKSTKIIIKLKQNMSFFINILTLQI